jgi:hypothetical protein
MALLSPKVIAQVSGRSAGKLGEMSWEWIMRADGQVFYRLTEVNGRRERNPWTLATRLPAAELQAIRGGKTKATEVLDVIVRQHGHRAESGARRENRLPGASTVCIRLGFPGTPAARLGGGLAVLRPWPGHGGGRRASHPNSPLSKLGAEAAGQRDADSRAVARDKPGDNRWSSRDNGRRGGGRGRRRP